MFCYTVVESERSCTVHASSKRLHLTRGQANTGLHCGTKSQPWLLEAPAGQRISISLVDFTPAATGGATSFSPDIDSRRESGTSRAGSRIGQRNAASGCVHQPHLYQYGYIIDKSATAAASRKNVSVCGSAGSQRLTSVYTSSSNSIELVLTNVDDTTAAAAVGEQFSFLLRIQGKRFP
jgi:hypothetical protein